MTAVYYVGRYGYMSAQALARLAFFIRLPSDYVRLAPDLTPGRLKEW